MLNSSLISAQLPSSSTTQPLCAARSYVYSDALRNCLLSVKLRHSIFCVGIHVFALFHPMPICQGSGLYAYRLVERGLACGPALGGPSPDNAARLHPRRSSVRSSPHPVPRPVPQAEAPALAVQLRQVWPVVLHRGRRVTAGRDGGMLGVDHAIWSR